MKILVLCFLVAFALAANGHTQEDEPDLQATATKNCDTRACNRNCLLMRQPGGFCLNDTCRCYPRFFALDENRKDSVVIKDGLVDGIGAVGPRMCVDATCNRRCRARNHSDGHCKSNRCICGVGYDNSENSFTADRKTDGDEIRLAAYEARYCIPHECSFGCLQKKRPGGYCDKDVCRCY